MVRCSISLAIVVGVLAGSGCKSESASESKPPEPPQSSIVQQLEAAGVTARDLNQGDDLGIGVWLVKHPEIAKNIAGPCKEAMKSDLKWQNSEEGKVCLAEKNAGLLK